MDWKSAEWDTLVCHCMNLDKQTIVNAVLEGANSMASLERKTRAGSGCGTCRDAVQELIKLYTAPGASGPSRCCGTGHCS